MSSGVDFHANPTQRLGKIDFTAQHTAEKWDGEQLQIEQFFAYIDEPLRKQRL